MLQRGEMMLVDACAIRCLCSSILYKLTEQLQVIGETNDMVRVMNYDMYTPATPRTDLTA